jgi:hypothetical protein
MLADSVLADIRQPDPNAPWDAQLRSYLRGLLDAQREYPGLAAFALDRPLSPAGRAAVAQRIAMLRRAGFDERTAVLVSATFHTYSFGVIGLESRFRGRRRSRGSAVAADVDARELNDFGLEALIDGFRARLRKSRERHLES